MNRNFAVIAEGTLTLIIEAGTPPLVVPTAPIHPSLERFKSTFSHVLGSFFVEGETADSELSAEVIGCAIDAAQNPLSADGSRNLICDTSANYNDSADAFIIQKSPTTASFSLLSRGIPFADSERLVDFTATLTIRVEKTANGIVVGEATVTIIVNAETPTLNALTFTAEDTLTNLLAVYKEDTTTRLGRFTVDDQTAFSILSAEVIGCTIDAAQNPRSANDSRNLICDTSANYNDSADAFILQRDSTAGAFFLQSRVITAADAARLVDFTATLTILVQQFNTSNFVIAEGTLIITVVAETPDLPVLVIPPVELNPPLASFQSTSPQLLGEFSVEGETGSSELSAEVIGCDIDAAQNPRSSDDSRHLICDTSANYNASADAFILTKNSNAASFSLQSRGIVADDAARLGDFTAVLTILVQKRENGEVVAEGTLLLTVVAGIPMLDLPPVEVTRGLAFVRLGFFGNVPISGVPADSELTAEIIGCTIDAAQNPRNADDSRNLVCDSPPDYDANADLFTLTKSTGIASFFLGTRGKDLSAADKARLVKFTAVLTIRVQQIEDGEVIAQGNIIVTAKTR